MRIIVTASEAITYGFWDKLCDLKGWDIWAVKEGQIDGGEEISLSVEEAQRLGVDWHVMSREHQQAWDRR